MFLSYDHEDAALQASALDLANGLRRGGIDAWVDLYEPAPAEGRLLWRERQILQASFVLVLCSASYRRQFEEHGVAEDGRQVRWEALFVRQRLHDDQGFRARVLPVVPPSATADDIPSALRSTSPYVLPAGYDDLYRHLAGQPEIVRPPLGELRRRIDNLGFRPPIFEGRTEELARIGQVLSGGRTAVVYPVITGLGGVGKTRLALEYAFVGDPEYDVRWRLRASGIASLQEDLVALGRRLGILGEVENIEHAAAEVQKWLSTHERWLLVFDNAEDPRELQTLLPSPGHGHVLITSRARAWRGVAEPIELDQLSSGAARAVLLRRSGQPDDGHASDLARQLGYLPLALVQAGAFVEATGCSFRGYLDRFEQFGLAMFQDAKAATGDYYEQTVAATWQVSLAMIAERSPHAKPLLQWLAFLDPNGVPLRLLREYPDGLPEDVAACVGSVNAFDDAVTVLRQFSMVDRVEEPEEGLRVHRLVQSVARGALDDAVQLVASATVDWLDGVFDYEPMKTPVSRVPNGIAEQLIVVGSIEACIAQQGHRLTWLLSATGDYLLRCGRLAAARATSQRSLEVAEGLVRAESHSAQAQRNLSVSLNFLGDVEVQAGNLAAARDLFRRSLLIREGLAKADPNSAHAQRDLSISLERLGDVEVQAGNLAAARGLFQRYREIAEGLAKVDLHGAQAQRDFSVSLEKLGCVEVRAGNLAAARGLFRCSLLIREGVARPDFHSAQAQRDLSISLNFLGDVEVRAGNLAAARDLFRRSLLIREGLAKADPNSAQAQRDLSVSLNFLGNVEVQAGNLAAARDLFQRSLEVADGLAKADSHSAQAQRDLSISLNYLGDVEVQAGNLAAARNLFQRSLLIREGLAKADPHSAQAQRDLSVSLNLLGDVEVQASNLAAARGLFQRCRDIAEELAKADPHSAQVQRDLSVSLEKLGNVEVRAGNLAAARDLFRRCLLIREGLAKADPHSAQAQRDISVSLNKLGKVEVQAGNLAARDLFRRCLLIREGLAKADPHSARAAFDVATSQQWLAYLAEQAGDRDARIEHLRAAKRILDAMEAKGQYRGYSSFERARLYVTSRLP